MLCQTNRLSNTIRQNKVLDYEKPFNYNVNDVLLSVKEVFSNENDISAKKEIESESSRLQSQNENGRRKKSSCIQKIKRKKEVISLGLSNVAFFEFWLR